MVAANHRLFRAVINSLLIANRGEIACRVIRTARRLKIRTVAVYSEADAEALHTRMADDAVFIGPSPARESYLRGEKIIEAARQTGAEAIHPGYGFLSENADFAQAVIDAGLIWVGPKPDSIRAMGLKDAAKKLMAKAGVPVTPGYLGEDQDPGRLKKEADVIGYPVLIKAVAGGGGKGMRRVDDAGKFEGALESAKREAASAFGDDRVLIEKYVLAPRHIEVQIFGDSKGNVVHLFERDCSLQRRHQKVIEEAPAPGMDVQTRQAVCDAAVRAAIAVNYEGAGTIEFIADASEGLRADRIWFMEMNTRLQVEHPVTEEITKQDLVEWQLRVASGELLPKRQDELAIDGHAIEARLYAEDPANGFLPSVGVLDVLELPFHLQNVRVETGVEEGDAISPFYDPMIAKLISHSDDRAQALQTLAEACAAVACAPVKTNAWFLKRLCEDQQFGHGEVTTGHIAQNLEALTTPPQPSDLLLQEVAEHFVWASRSNDGGSHASDGALESGLTGFRVNQARNVTLHLYENNRPVDVNIDPSLDADASDWLRANEMTGDAEDATFFEGGAAFDFALAFRGTGASHGLHDGEIEAPMPGKVTAVEVAPGDKVAKGQRLLTLEAMKMEHALTSPFDGRVSELNAEAGDQVKEGQRLVVIEAEAAAA